VVHDGVARPCHCSAVSAKKARKWFKAGFINAGELLLITGDPVQEPLQLCFHHLVAKLEQRAPGAARRIYRDAYKHWTRSTSAMVRTTAAMRRLGLIKRSPFPRAYGPKRCRAKSKRSRLRCKKWALKGSGVCHMHGSARPETRGHAARGRSAQIASDRARRQHDRERKKAARAARAGNNMLPLSVGFRQERPQPQSMYDDFRSGRGSGRKRDDWSPY
jgi:hypothetical protein